MRLENYYVAINRNDCLLLLKDIEDRGINTAEAIKELIKSKDATFNVLKFINDNRKLEVSDFYEYIRKSYNAKKSNLYKNIVKEIDDPNEVLTTLSAMETQILLHAKNVSNRQLFLRHSRAEEITLVLSNYFKTYDITNCIKLLKLIKCDIKCLEAISGRISLEA